MIIIKKVMVFTIIISFILGYVAGSPHLFKTGNPVIVIRGMIQLSFSQDQILQISSNPERYLSRMKDGNYPIVEFMNKEGWVFEENMGLGRGYGPVFSKEGDRKGFKEVQYSRKYRIWEEGR